MKAPRVFGWVGFQSHAHLCGQEDDSLGRGTGEMSRLRPEGLGAFQKQRASGCYRMEESGRGVPKRKHLSLMCKL